MEIDNDIKIQDEQMMSSGMDARVQKKHNKNWVLVALAVVAVVGVVFGIIGTITSVQKSNELRDLKADLAEETEDGAKASDDTLVEITEIEEGEGSHEVSNNVTLAHDYIYVGAWGKKFKIPEDLTSVSYVYDASGNDSLCVSGVKVRPGGMDYFPEFGNLFSEYGTENCLGILTREVVDGTYTYRYHHPQAVNSTTKDEQEWEMESVDLVQQMLTENDSEF